MYQSVSDRVIEQSLALYNYVEHMYCDKEVRVLVGIAHHMPDVDAAKRIPFRWKDTQRRATAKEISAEWVAIRQMGISNWRVDHPKQSSLYLNRVDADRLALLRSMQIDQTLEKKYPEYRRWPAEAQLATILLSWLGDDLKDIDVALRHQKFALAGTGLSADTTTARHAKELLRSAGMVIETNAVRSKFWYPQIPNAV